METPLESAAVAVHPLTRDLLEWLARAQRTYAETMEAWRSSCPRLTIWEDALADGLIQVECGPTGEIAALTPRGRAALTAPR